MKLIFEQLQEVLLDESKKRINEPDFQENLKEIEKMKQVGLLRKQGFTILPIDTISKKYYDSFLNYQKR
jgi:hypothetical protein